MIAYWDIETFNQDEEMKEIININSGVEQNKNSNITDTAIPFVIGISF